MNIVPASIKIKRVDPDQYGILNTLYSRNEYLTCSSIMSCSIFFFPKWEVSKNHWPPGPSFKREGKSLLGKHEKLASMQIVKGESFYFVDLFQLKSLVELVKASEDAKLQLAVLKSLIMKPGHFLFDRKTKTNTISTIVSSVSIVVFLLIMTRQIIDAEAELSSH